MIKIERKEAVDFIKVQNDKKMELILCSLGASIYDLKVPSNKGIVESVVVTPKNLDDFYKTDAYYGKSVGRYSGRIDHAQCEIEGKKYNLEKNWNGVNALHGGYKGLSFQNFTFEVQENENQYVILFSYLEKEDLLPGDLNVQIIYRIEKYKNEFQIEFVGKTNKTTLCNLTNHTYFNLSGNLKNRVLSHQLQLNCDHYTKLNNDLITTSIEKVNKVMDFTTPHAIGDYIQDESLQKHTAAGYDHCFCKTNVKDQHIATYFDEENGRSLQVFTDYPCIVIYCNNYPKPFAFFHKEHLEKHDAICLECQFIPNGINMENVDKSLLRPNEEYHHFIRYCFN